MFGILKISEYLNGPKIDKEHAAIESGNDDETRNCHKDGGDGDEWWITCLSVMRGVICFARWNWIWEKNTEVSYCSLRFSSSLLLSPHKNDPDRHIWKKIAASNMQQYLQVSCVVQFAYIKLGNNWEFIYCDDKEFEKYQRNNFFKLINVHCHRPTIEKIWHDC